MFKVIYY